MENLQKIFVTAPNIEPNIHGKIAHLKITGNWRLDISDSKMLNICQFQQKRHQVVQCFAFDARLDRNELKLV